MTTAAQCDLALERLMDASQKYELEIAQWRKKYDEWKKLHDATKSAWETQADLDRRTIASGRECVEMAGKIHDCNKISKGACCWSLTNNDPRKKCGCQYKKWCNDSGICVKSCTTANKKNAVATSSGPVQCTRFGARNGAEKKWTTSTEFLALPPEPHKPTPPGDVTFACQVCKNELSVEDVSGSAQVENIEQAMKCILDIKQAETTGDYSKIQPIEPVESVDSVTELNPGPVDPVPESDPEDPDPIASFFADIPPTVLIGVPTAVLVLLVIIIISE